MERNELMAHRLAQVRDDLRGLLTTLESLCRTEVAANSETERWVRDLEACTSNGIHYCARLNEWTDKENAK